MAAFTAVAPTVRGTLDGLPSSIPLVLSGAYTATAHAEFAAPLNCRVIEAVCIQTSGTAGQAPVLSIEAWDPAASTPGSDVWETLIASAAISSATTATTVVQVDPYASPITNSSAQRAPRRRMRVTMTHPDTKSVTYSISVHGA